VSHLDKCERHHKINFSAQLGTKIRKFLTAMILATTDNRVVPVTGSLVDFVSSMGNEQIFRNKFVSPICTTKLKLPQ